jgi:geranylgeranyl diphosphate synthase type II
MSQADQIGFPDMVLRRFPEGVRRVVPGPANSTNIDALQTLIDRRLNALCPEAAGLPHPLGPSMRYSLLAPGKRLRPLLTMLTAMQCGSDAGLALNAACAAEMVHVASLIFDDLPCMDDATLRRGQPTNHLAFGEDTAILSAVSLLALAFRTITEDDNIPRDARVTLVSALSRAIGPGGLVAGQVSDLRDFASDAGIVEIRERNFRKTAALFCACGEAGVIVGGGTDEDRAQACCFAENIGMAFQILDDLKDAILSSLQIGKDVRQDKTKRTVVSALGRTHARAELHHHLDRARLAAGKIGVRHDPLLAFLQRCFPQSMLDEIAAG